MDAPANVVAQIAGRLQAVLVELHRLDAAERLLRTPPPRPAEPKPAEVAKRDELERRREQRQSAAARRSDAGRTGGKRRA